MSILGIFDLLCRDLHKSELEATISKKATNPEVISQTLALCQMMLVKRNLRIIGDQEDYFLLIFFSLKAMHYRDES